MATFVVFSLAIIWPVVTSMFLFSLTFALHIAGCLSIVLNGNLPDVRKELLTNLPVCPVCKAQCCALACSNLQCPPAGRLQPTVASSL